MTHGENSAGQSAAGIPRSAETVAVLGAGGTMGFAMARNIARAGIKVRAWNRTRAKAEPLADDGACIAATPAQAATGASIVLTMLADADAVVAAMEGDDGALPVMADSRQPELAGREERRHGIDVGGKRHGERAAPLDKDVETPRLHFHALDPAIVKSRQGSQVVVEVLAHPLFVIGDRFDIDQRPCEFEYVHKISVSWGED